MSVIGLAAASAQDRGEGAWQHVSSGEVLMAAEASRLMSINGVTTVWTLNLNPFVDEDGIEQVLMTVQVRCSDRHMRITGMSFLDARGVAQGDSAYPDDPFEAYREESNLGLLAAGVCDGKWLLGLPFRSREAWLDWARKHRQFMEEMGIRPARPGAKDQARPTGSSHDARPQ